MEANDERVYQIKIYDNVLTSYQTVTIIRSNRKVTYDIIRQTQRRSAYFPDVDFKCRYFVYWMEKADESISHSSFFG